MIHDARIIYLFEKYRNRQTTFLEEQELQGYFADPVFENKLKVLLGDAFERQIEEYSFSRNQTDRLLERINERDEHKRRAIKSLPHWLSAAAVALLLVFGAYYWWNYSVGSGILINRSTPLKKETGWPNALTLTLSNGKTLLLDNMQQGAVIEDAGVRITKGTAGELQYEEQGKKKEYSSALHRIHVPYGKQMCVRLADGTVVVLNACSALTYSPSMSLGKRWVKLIGEAYFEVERTNREQPYKTSAPFVIEAKGQHITVLGTRFNVSAYPDETDMKTTLVTGKIKLNQTLLKPGEQATLKEGNVVLKQVNAHQIMAWTKGYIILDHENIYSIMRKIARWYHVKVTYQGTLPLDDFGGAVKHFNRIEDLLDILAELGGVHFKILEAPAGEKERRIIVMP